MKSMYSRSLCLSSGTTFLILSLATLVGYADFSGSDNFSNGSAKWDAVTNIGSASLTVINGRYEFAASGAGTVQDMAWRRWNVNQGSYTNDWAVQVDVHLNAFPVLGDGQFINLNLAVQDGAAATRFNHAYFVSINRDARPKMDFESGFANAITAEIPSPTTDAALRISFDCAAKTLTAWYDANGVSGGYAWVPMETVSIATGTNDWGMTTASQFNVCLAVGSGKDEGGPNIAVTGSQAYFDNFLTSSLPSPTNSVAIAIGGASMGHAFDGSNYLVGIENPSLTLVGAQMIAANGAKVGELILTGRTGIATTVAFDGTNYLMIWEDDELGAITDWSDGGWQIYGQFISKAGSAVGAPFAITTRGIEFDGIKTMAFGGGKYLVTYTRLLIPENGEASDNRYIAGRIVDPSGTMGSEFRISTGYGDVSDIAFDGTNFFVVWREDFLDREIRGRFVSPVGVLGAEVSVNASAASSDNPESVTFDGTNYLVVWNDEVGGTREWDSFGQLVSTSGVRVGGVITITSEPGSQMITSVAFDGTRYMAVWIDMQNSANWDVYGQYLNKNGVLVGSKMPIATAAGNQMGVVGFANGKYLVGVNSGVIMGDGGLSQVEVCHGVFIAPLAAFPNQPPLVSKQFPAADPAAVSEGTSVAFSVTASDNADLDTASRGMSNITWYVDGALKQVTKTGAPNAITSAFTLKTDATTVQGVAFRDLQVRAVALDKQGWTTETNWTLRVNNVPVAQTITFKALPALAIGATNFNPGAKASSGLQVLISNSNPEVAEVVDGLIQINGAGVTVITASQPGNFDFKAATPVKQTMTVKARLTIEVLSGGGTVTGAGLYVPGTKVALSAKPATGNTFLRWEDGSQTASRSLVMPGENTTVSAWFGVTTNVPQPVVADPATQRAMVGIPFQLPLDVTSDSLPTITVTGLPTGLSYSAATKTIAGVPTASVTNRTVTVTAKNVNKTPATQTFSMTVDPLPAWAQGNFNGVTGMDALGSGSASMSVTSAGGVSGKLTLRGTNFTFSSKAYASRGSDGSFFLVTTAKVGKVAWPLTVSVNVPEITDPSDTVPQTLSKAEGVLNGTGWTTLYRNVWKDAGMFTVLTNRLTGYYTATLPGGLEHGSGYLTFTVDKLGGVKTSGKLADGTAVSLSGSLILDETGRAFAVLYTAPLAYKGGGLFGLAEFFKADDGAKVIVRLLDGEPLVWESLSLTTTQVYGAGFSRDLGLSGGWYDTLGNLYAYYSNRVMTVGTEGMPVPEILVGTNRYDSVCWDPDGLALTVVTNKLGVMTGFTAPKAVTPVKVGAAYDYANPTNAVGLTVALTRATGVFKGSFKAWFDYATTHTPKSIKYEGVLTPERLNMDDGIAGRGFFLWADKSLYLNPQGRPVPYSFSWSYDLSLLLSE